MLRPGLVPRGEEAGREEETPRHPRADTELDGRSSGKPSETDPVAEARDKPGQPRKQPAKQIDRDDGEDESDADENAPAAPSDVAVTGSLAESIGVVSRDGMTTGYGRRLRLTTSLAGGFTRARGETAGLLVLGGRIEYGRSLLVGVDASARLVGGDDTQGRVMLSFAKFGLARYLELGAAIGTHFGGGIGVAGSLSLRYHLPPAPRASLFLRYDGAYIDQDETRRGQNELTLGLEWGF